HSVPQVDTGASACGSAGNPPYADDQTTRLGHRFATGQKMARSRPQTHLRCRPWFKHASISALLGDSEPETACSWQRPTWPPQPASGGPPRLVPRTFRAALAGPLTTGPGVRANDMPGPGD
ncbi:MAG: hypothetical protein OXO50_00780, partial [Caldilineaceae bacterium]|nr:hypothetical protein [Caldilineaceae bacterium]